MCVYIYIYMNKYKNPFLSLRYGTPGSIEEFPRSPDSEILSLRLLGTRTDRTRTYLTIYIYIYIYIYIHSQEEGKSQARAAVGGARREERGMLSERLSECGAQRKDYTIIPIGCITSAIGRQCQKESAM